MSLIFPILALLIALSVIYFFISSIIRSFNFDIKKLLTSSLLKKKALILKAADSAVESKNYSLAGKHLKDALILNEPMSRISTLSNIFKHNRSVVARLIALSHTKKLNIPNLELLDELFQIREELLKNYSDIDESYRSFKSRRNLRGSKTPEWATEGFKKNKVELSEKLATNKLAILNTFEASIRTISEGVVITTSSDIQVH